MIYLAEDTSTTASRCMELIARYAPVFMRIGGGSLEQNSRCRGYKLTTEDRNEIVAAAATAKDGYEISKKTGWSPATVCRVMREEHCPSPLARRRAEKFAQSHH